MNTNIRNITASVCFYTWEKGSPLGAFNTTQQNEEVLSAGNSQGIKYNSLNLNANESNNNSSNKMAGHANGDDIHPYSLYLVPLISY